MKILYGVQATGNGHIMRLREILPYLQERATVDVLAAGSMSSINLEFPVMKKHGLSFFYKDGGLDYLSSIKRAKIMTLVRDIKNLRVEDYDIVISDFEPITAWACKTKGVPCISMSHQVCFSSDKTPRPVKRDFMAEAVLNYYAPYGDKKIGFHFGSYDTFIHQPPVRKEILTANVEDLGHYTVYLAAHSSREIINVLSQFKATWHVFANDAKKEYCDGDITVHPLNAKRFTESLVSSRGVICGAGFETPSEVLYMGKRLLCIPIKGQYEQECNGAALEKMGVMTSRSFNADVVDKFMESKPITVKFKNNIQDIVDEHVFGL